MVAAGFDCSVPPRRRVVSNRVVHREAPPPVVLTGETLMAVLRADGECVRREWDRAMEEALARHREMDAEVGRLWS